MKAARSLLPALVGLAIGGTLGYLTREPKGPDRLPEAAPNNHATRAAPDARPKQPVPDRPSVFDAGRLAAQLEASARIKNEFPRCREITRTIETIPTEILPDVLTQASGSVARRESAHSSLQNLRFSHHGPELRGAARTKQRRPARGSKHRIVASHRSAPDR